MLYSCSPSKSSKNARITFGLTLSAWPNRIDKLGPRRETVVAPVHQVFLDTKGPYVD